MDQRVSMLSDASWMHKVQHSSSNKNSTEGNQSTEKPTNGSIPKMDTDVSMDKKLDVKDEGLAGEDENTDDDEAFPDIIDCNPDEDNL
eukprot:7501696-Ditylum_brightwellii.AAC.1